jgi:hypothetical protein
LEDVFADFGGAPIEASNGSSPFERIVVSLTALLIFVESFIAV